MEVITIYPQGVCCRQITLEHEDGIITSATFLGGCQGNTTGVAKLLIGRKLEDVQQLLEGIKCRGSRNAETSCPDQLSKGIKKHLG